MENASKVLEKLVKNAPTGMTFAINKDNPSQYVSSLFPDEVFELAAKKGYTMILVRSKT